MTRWNLRVIISRSFVEVSNSPYRIIFGTYRSRLLPTTSLVHLFDIIMLEKSYPSDNEAPVTVHVQERDHLLGVARLRFPAPIVRPGILSPSKSGHPNLIYTVNPSSGHRREDDVVNVCHAGLVDGYQRT